MIMNLDKSIKVRVPNNKLEHWNWCCDNARNWVKDGDLSTDGTYNIMHPEDAMAFKLKFAL